MLKNSLGILLLKEFSSQGENWLWENTFFLLLQCLKSSFTLTPTITPTSYPNKIYKNCCTPGKKKFLSLWNIQLTIPKYLRGVPWHLPCSKKSNWTYSENYGRVRGLDPNFKQWKRLLWYKEFMRKIVFLLLHHQSNQRSSGRWDRRIRGKPVD